MEQSYCKNCKFKNGCQCKVYAGRSIFDIKVCPLTTRYYMNLDHMSQFVLDNNPELFTRWVSKQIPMKIGDSLITLKSGFGGSSGKKLKVSAYNHDNGELILTDDNNTAYAITSEFYYLGVVKEILPEEELKEAVDELKILEELVEDVNVDKYSESVYNSFRKEVCYYCFNQTQCECTKIDIFKCPKFENYFEI